MIYLLAILWFASGFLPLVWMLIKSGDRTLKLGDLLISCLLSIFGPIIWIVFCLCFASDRIVGRLNRITLFKARNK